MERELVGVRIGRRPVQPLEDRRDPAVKLPRAGLAQLRVQRGLQRRVGKVVVHVVGRLDVRKHTVASQLVDRSQQIRLGELRQRPQHRVRNARAEDRGEIRDRSGGRRQPLEPCDDCVANGVRQIEIGLLPARPSPVGATQPSGGDERLQHLIGEERVASRALVQRRRELANRRGVDTEDVGEQRIAVAPREGAEPQDSGGRESDERTLRVDECRVRLPLRVVVRAENGDVLALQLTRDEMQELERGRVRPLQVLEDDEQRTSRREAAKKLTEAPQQARLELRRVASHLCARNAAHIERREETGELPLAATREHRERRLVHGLERRQQRVREQRVRHAGFDRIRSSDRGRPAAAQRRVHDGVREPGLADPAVASKEGRRRHPTLPVLERTDQRSQLRFAADERQGA